MTTDQDHGIIISNNEDGTGYTVMRYSDARGQAYDLQTSIMMNPELAALGEYDSESGCFFADTYTSLNAQLIAGAILERLQPEPSSVRTSKLEEQARAEKAFTDAARTLMQDHAYSRSDLDDMLERS